MGTHLFARDSFGGSTGEKLYLRTPNPGPGHLWKSVAAFDGDGVADELAEHDANGRITLDNQAATAAYYLLASPLTKSYDVECQVYRGSSGGGYVGLIARLDPLTGSCYVLRYDPENDNLQLYTAAGSWTDSETFAASLTSIAGPASAGISAGSSGLLKFSVRTTGNTLAAYVDGVSKLTNTDATITRIGFVGLYLHAATAPGATPRVSIDGFRATDQQDRLTIGSLRDA